MRSCPAQLLANTSVWTDQHSRWEASALGALVTTPGWGHCYISVAWMAPLLHLTLQAPNIHFQTKMQTRHFKRSFRHLCTGALPSSGLSFRLVPLPCGDAATLGFTTFISTFMLTTMESA